MLESMGKWKTFVSREEEKKNLKTLQGFQPQPGPNK